MGLRAYNLSGVTQYVITDGVRPIFPNGLSGPIGAYSFASIAPSTGGTSVFAVLPPAAAATYPNNKSIPLPDLFSGAVPVGVPVDITEMMASAREAAFVLLETARLVDPQRVYFVWTGPPEFRTGTLQVATPANVGGFTAKRVFTVATRPSAALNTGGEIVVSDAVPTGDIQRSDGAEWRSALKAAVRSAGSVTPTDTIATGDTVLADTPITPGAGNWLANFTTTIDITTFSGIILISLYVDGVQVAQSLRSAQYQAFDRMILSTVALLTGVLDGQVIDVRWRKAGFGGPTTVTSYSRELVLMRAA